MYSTDNGLPWLIFWGAVVVLGVLLVGYEQAAAIKKHGWRPLAAKIGLLLLVLGLIGEVWWGIRIWNTRTRHLDDMTRLAGGLNQKGAELWKTQAELNEQIGKLRRENLALQQAIRVLVERGKAEP